MQSRFAYLLFLLLALSSTLAAQIQPIPSLTVQPVPIPGGDLVSGYGIANLFVPGPPGQTPPFDPLGAEPNGITNFKGQVAMGYTSGLATDNNGRQYVVITDIRVFKGTYRGGKAADPVNTAGATVSETASGIFVEI
jgi:hypothetical protein